MTIIMALMWSSMASVGFISGKKSFLNLFMYVYE
jgi:hypothetical protein